MVNSILSTSDNFHKLIRSTLANLVFLKLVSVVLEMLKEANEIVLVMAFVKAGDLL